MRLVGLALLDDDLRLERRRGLERLGRLQRREALEELGEGAVGTAASGRPPVPVRTRVGGGGGNVLEVADDERAAARARPAAVAKLEDRVARERPQVLLGAEHGPPERMLAERRAVDELLGDRRGLVLVALDLLDDDPALLVELVGVDVGAPDEVRQQVGGVGGRLGAHGDVKRDEVMRGVGVQRAAEALGGLVDVAVMGELLSALEDEVLEEVRHPVLLGALRARTGVERDEDRDCARAVDSDPVQGQAVGQRRGDDRGHDPTVAPAGRGSTATLSDGWRSPRPRRAAPPAPPCRRPARRPRTR